MGQIITTFDNKEHGKCLYDNSYKEEWIKEDDGSYWYVIVERYSVNPKYSKDGTDSYQFMSDNVCKIVDGNIVWKNDYYMGKNDGALLLRLMQLWNKVERTKEV